MRQFSKYLIIFVLAVIVFGYVEWTPSLADPDSFYHARFSAMLKDDWPLATSGKFPWLYFTVWRDAFTDHHFLYHLLIIPVISVVSAIPSVVPAAIAPLIAVKAGAVILAAAFFLVFYWFLRAHKIYGAFFYTLIPLLSGGTLYRFGLPKAPVLSAIFLILILYCLFRKKYWRLAALAFFYVWAYGGWPMMFIFAGFYILAEILKEKLAGRLNQKILVFERFKPLVAMFFGALAGLLFNPYFPANIKFYLLQYGRIFYTGFQNEVRVGNEWYPPSMDFLLTYGFLLWIIGIFSILIFLYGIMRNKSPRARIDYVAETFAILFIFGAFLVWTIQSSRNIEYLVPFGVLFFAFLNNFNREVIKKPGEIFEFIFGKQKTFAAVILIFLAAVMAVHGLYSVYNVRNSFAQGAPLQKYKPAAEWLATNAPAGGIIFHDRWDTFPNLFYWNTRNYYIFGADPTSFWAYDRDLYRTYNEIIFAEKKEGLAEIIRQKFNGEYVFLDMQTRAFDENLKKDRRFKLVYWDWEAKIYKVE